MGEGGNRKLIRVMPFDEVGAYSPPAPARDVRHDDPLAWAVHRRYTETGRAALAAVLRSIEPEPDDEVLITNSSGQQWISSCVTCTVFNHCQPSRVLTERTRAILVIHEFGYPHPRLHELCAVARDRGILLIEDCAHSLDSTLGGRPLGSFGDFAIFSLPKVIPVRSGGILVSAGPMPDVIADGAGHSATAEAAYRAHLPSMDEYAQRRRHNYAAVRESFPEFPLLLEAEPGVTPFCIGLLTSDAPEIRRRSSAIEWGSTLREDLLLVTTNPFVRSQDLIAALGEALPRRKHS